MEPKIVVAAKDGVADVDIKLGNHVIGLTDQTKWQYKTSNLSDFIAFCKMHADPKSEYVIYYNADKAVLTPLEPTRYTKQLAEVTMAEHVALKRLRNALSTKMDTEGFERFLKTMRPYVGDIAGVLIPFLRNHQISKLTSIKREVDNRGNFSYSVTREKGGTDEFPIPEQLKITIPIFDGLSNQWIAFDCDLVFTWKETEDGAKTFYSLENVLFDDLLTEARKTIMESHLKEIGCEMYWGTMTVIEQDDRWGYLLNKNS